MTTQTTQPTLPGLYDGGQDLVPVTPVAPVTAAKVKKATEDAHGTCALLGKPGKAPGSVSVNGKVYELAVIRVAGQVAGYRVGEYEVSVVDPAKPRCSCPDYRYRRQNTGTCCKHGAAVRKLVQAGLV